MFFITTNIYASDDIIVNQNMFISKFQSHDNPMIYNITHDIYLNESMLFLDDNYNEYDIPILLEYAALRSLLAQ